MAENQSRFGRFITRKRVIAFLVVAVLAVGFFAYFGAYFGANRGVVGVEPDAAMQLEFGGGGGGLLPGIPSPPPPKGNPCSPDKDNDTFNTCEDCDDNDANVNPGAVEVCDGKDNNCDGEVDNIVSELCSVDSFYDGTTSCSNGQLFCNVNLKVTPEDPRDSDDLQALIEYLKPGVSAAFNWWKKPADFMGIYSRTVVNLPMLASFNNSKYNFTPDVFALEFPGKLEAASGNVMPKFSDGGFSFSANNGICIPTNNSYLNNFFNRSRRWTWEVYFNGTPSLSNYKEVVAKGGENYALLTRIYSDGKVNCYITGKNSSGSVVAAGVYSAAGTADGPTKRLVTCVVMLPENKIRIYVDGSYVAVGSANEIVEVKTTSSIGVGAQCGNYLYSLVGGWIGDFKIYPEALFDEQIAMNWQAIQEKQAGRFISDNRTFLDESWFAKAVGTTDSDGKNGSLLRSNNVTIG